MQNNRIRTRELTLFDLQLTFTCIRKSFRYWTFEIEGTAFFKWQSNRFLLLCVCASELARTKSNHTDLSYDNDRCVIAHFHWNKFKLCGLIKTISMLMQWWERFKMQIQGIVEKRAGIFSNNGLPCTLMKIVWPSQRFPFIRKFSSIVVICWRAHF